MSLLVRTEVEGKIDALLRESQWTTIRVGRLQLCRASEASSVTDERDGRILCAMPDGRTALKRGCRGDCRGA